MGFIQSQKKCLFALSVSLAIEAIAHPLFAQGRSVKVYVSHAAATLTDVPYYIAREKRFYLDEGLDPDKDVNILAIGGGTNVWSAIQSGAVEAAILWPPFDVVANKMGMKKLLFVGDLIKLLGGGVMAPDQILRDNPDRAKRFLRA